MSELWSAQQHEWLAALGHTVYVPGSAEPAMAVGGGPAAATGEPVPAAVREQAPVRSTPRRPPADAEPIAAAPRAGATPHRSASRLPDKLHFALVRASGCDPQDPDAAAIIARWPASSELRGRPDAKRALWPQLRAMRRPRAQ
ncbi:MAG: alanine acetyltransferase [Lysobacteraceae bacterium]|nr:MAG: alanine acetyltransferase [Xanthomonadaceae bacterium]